MTDPRRAVFAFLGPYLKSPGWGDKALLEGFDHHLDLLGVPRAGPSEPATAPGGGMVAGGTAVSGAGGASGGLTGPISMVDASLLGVACPAIRAEALQQWVEPIRKACVEFEINTIRRVAAFIAQMAHESQCFARTEENLNYRAERLCQVWPGRFPSLAVAAPYARNPEKLANRVYAGRIGNGDEASGDGWRFRGGGPLQLTGRANWQGFADAVNMPLDQAVVYGRTPEGGVMAAAWFWEANDINRLADTPGVADESKRINGGDIGLADRKAKFDALVAEMLRRGA